MGLYRDYIGYIMGLYRGYIGIMENQMETTIMGNIGIIGYIVGTCTYEL